MKIMKDNVKQLINDEIEQIYALINGLEVKEVSTKRLEELMGNLDYVKEELKLYFEKKEEK